MVMVRISLCIAIADASTWRPLIGAYQVFANFRLMRIVLIPFGIVSMKRYAAVKVRGQRPEGRMLGRSGRVAPLLPESESDLDSESP